MEFRISTHKRSGKPMVGLWRDGEFIAAIYDNGDTIRLVSNYLDGVEHEVSTPPSIVIKFSK